MKYIYYIKLYNSNCNFSLKINDIEVFASDDNSQISSYFPINTFLQSDKNVCELIMYPLKNQNKLDKAAFTTLSLEMASYDNLDKKIKIEDFQLPNFYTSTPDKLPADSKNVFPLKVDGSPKGALLNNLKKPDDLITFQKLVLGEFIIVHQLFKDKKISEIVKILVDREKDLALNLFDDYDKRISNLEKKIIGLVNDSKQELLKFDPAMFEVKIENYGKLFSLKDNKNLPAIIYYNKELGLGNLFDFKFGMLKDPSKFVIIR